MLYAKKIISMFVFLIFIVSFDAFAMKGNVQGDFDKTGEEKRVKQQISFEQLPDELKLIIIEKVFLGITDLGEALKELGRLSNNEEFKRILLDEVFQYKLFLQCCDKQQLSEYKQKLNKFLFTATRILEKEKFPEYINQEAFFQVATWVVKNNISNKGGYWYPILELLRVLVEKEYKPAFEVATQIAKNDILNEDYRCTESMLNLLKVLVEKEYEPAFEVATQIAKNDILEVATQRAKNDILSEGYKRIDSTLNLRTDSMLELLKVLVEKEYKPAFEVATQIAKNDILSSSLIWFRHNNVVLQLFKALVETGYEPVIKKVTKIAKNNILSEDLFESETALRLFRILVRQECKKEFQKVEIFSGIMEEDAYEDLKLCEILIENIDNVKNKKIKEQIILGTDYAAGQGVQRRKKKFRGRALGLFKALVMVEKIDEDNEEDKKSKDTICKRATEAANDNVFDRSAYIKGMALALFKELLNKDYKPAFKAALKKIEEKRIDDDDIDIIKNMLLISLLKKGYKPAFKIAETKALKLIEDEDYNILNYNISKGISLLVELVKNNQNFKKATKVAANNVFHREDFVRSSAFELFEALFNKNHKAAFEKANSVAKNNFSNDQWTIRMSILDLFEMLIKNIDKVKNKKLKNQIIKNAEEAVEENINYDVRSVQKQAEQLKKILANFRGDALPETMEFNGKTYSILEPLTYSALLSKNNKIVTAVQKNKNEFDIFKATEINSDLFSTKFGKKFNPKNPDQTRILNSGTPDEITVSVFGAKKPWQKVTVNGEDYRLLGKKVYPRLKRNGKSFTIVGDEIFPTYNPEGEYITLTGVMIAPYVKKDDDAYILLGDDVHRKNILTPFGGRMDPEDEADPSKTAFREFQEETINSFEDQIKPSEIKEKIDDSDDLRELFRSNYHAHKEFLITFFVNFTGVDMDKILNEFKNRQKAGNLTSGQAEKQDIMWVSVRDLKNKLENWKDNYDKGPMVDDKFEIVAPFAIALKTRKGQTFIKKMLQN